MLGLGLGLSVGKWGEGTLGPFASADWAFLWVKGAGESGANDLYVLAGEGLWVSDGGGYEIFFDPILRVFVLRDEGGAGDIYYTSSPWFSGPIEGVAWSGEGVPVVSPNEECGEWIAAVEVEDGEVLEWGVRRAMGRLVGSAKALGVWDENAQLTVAAGARTLDGALLPLLGSALTNFNFVSGDYTRKGGLKGDGATKYLQSVAGNSYPQNDFSVTIYITELGMNYYHGMGTTGSGSTTLSNSQTRCRCSTLSNVAAIPIGFNTITRNNTSHYLLCNTTETINNVSSDGNSVFNYKFFCRGSGTPQNFGNARISIFFLKTNINDVYHIWRQILDQYHIDINAAIQ